SHRNLRLAAPEVAEVLIQATASPPMVRAFQPCWQPWQETAPAYAGQTQAGRWQAASRQARPAAGVTAKFPLPQGPPECPGCAAWARPRISHRTDWLQARAQDRTRLVLALPGMERGPEPAPGAARPRLPGRPRVPARTCWAAWPSSRRRAAAGRQPRQVQ